VIDPIRRVDSTSQPSRVDPTRDVDPIAAGPEGLAQAA